MFLKDLQLSDNNYLKSKQWNRRKWKCLKSIQHDQGN